MAISLSIHLDAQPDPLWALTVGIVLFLVYPFQAWRDAPIFPTGRKSLTPLLDGPWSKSQSGLDLGSGLGDGLIALRGIAPHAMWTGVEMSGLLVSLSRIRCPWACIIRCDMWYISWAKFDLIYVFQRPETMQRLWEKATRELSPGKWVLSFQFPVPGRAPDWSAQNHRGQWIFAYQTRPTESSEKEPMLEKCPSQNDCLAACSNLEP
jgi:hypothetical protein